MIYRGAQRKWWKTMLPRFRRSLRRNALGVWLVFAVALLCGWQLSVLVNSPSSDKEETSTTEYREKNMKLSKVVVSFQDDTLQKSAEFERSWRTLTDNNMLSMSTLTAQFDRVVELAHEMFNNLSGDAVTVHSSSISPTTGIVPFAHGEFIYFSLINAAYRVPTENWLCNTANMTNVHERTLIVVTDRTTADLLAEEWPRVTFHYYELHLQPKPDDVKLGSKALQWGKIGYGAFLNLRAEIIARLAEANVQFVLFETDAVWLKNPEPLFSNFTNFMSGDVDIAIPLKGREQKGLTLSFDPMLVVPTEKSKRFLRTMSDWLNGKTERRGAKNITSAMYDQDILDELCKSQYQGLVCRSFEYADVADGPWFEMNEQERVLRLHRRTPYIVNNNFYVGIRNKINRQALNGLWFLVGHKCRFDMVDVALKKHRRMVIDDANL